MEVTRVWRAPESLVSELRQKRTRGGKETGGDDDAGMAAVTATLLVTAPVSLDLSKGPVARFDVCAGAPNGWQGVGRGLLDFMSARIKAEASPSNSSTASK